MTYQGHEFSEADIAARIETEEAMIFAGLYDATARIGETALQQYEGVATADAEVDHMGQE